MAENVEIVKGASLWGDAWKRLLKNKLAVFGLIVISIMIVAVIIGPAVIRWTTDCQRYIWPILPVSHGQECSR